MDSIQGRCLCCVVVFEVADDFKYAGYCHCSQCRRLSGSAFSSFGGIVDSNLKIVSGSDFITFYKKSESSNIAFCKKCGSHLFSQKTALGLYHVRLGVLDRSPTLQPQAHIFVGSKAAWFNFCDDLPKFSSLPPTQKTT